VARRRRPRTIVEVRREIVLGLLVAATARAAPHDEMVAAERAVPKCDRARAHCFGIQLHIAADEHGLVVPTEWIVAQLAAANHHFTPLDVGYQVVGVDSLPPSAFHIETRHDRDELAVERLGGKLIHVFVVGRLEDVDQDGKFIYGVTWHQRKDDRKYIIVSNAALPRTLAHELGHFFGLPHSSYAISIMNKSDRKDPPPDQRTFADEEISAMRPTLKRLLRDKVIADL
jgi:hypothetical protein